MKFLCCQKKSNQHFLLASEVCEKFDEQIKSDSFWIDATGYEIDKAVAKNALVYPGMVLAVHPDPLCGDLHAPVVGTVNDVSNQGILISLGAPKPKPKKAVEGEEAKPEEPLVIPTVEPLKLDGLTGYDLREPLKKLGISIKTIVELNETLVINGLNPDPEVCFAKSMLIEYKDTIQKAIFAIHNLNSAIKLVLAVDDATGVEFEGVEIKVVPAVYPSSLNQLVIKAVTGIEAPEKVASISLHEVFGLGLAMETGLPLTKTALSVKGKNYLVDVGTSLSSIIDVAGIDLEDNDVLLLNGPMRGRAQFRLQGGVSKNTYSMHIVKSSSIPQLEGDNPCVSCGECVQVCPARIQPDKISRYSEFELYDSCKDYHMELCMDCGMCSYVCISRRPVLQYIRMAKKHIAAQER